MVDADDRQALLHKATLVTVTELDRHCVIGGELHALNL